MTLNEFFSIHPKAALGFSGGVDSAYLLYAAVRNGAQVQPYFVKTPFQPEFELRDARRLAAELKERALSDGFSLFLDGTNASDDWGDRPGMKALKELEIRSPLRECGLIKEEIRRLSKEAGLFTWNKPSYACLATRFPTGTGLTEENLQKVEQAESALAEMGFSDYRVRVCQGAARLQFPEKQWLRAAENREKICEAVKPFFYTILLDMEVR